MITRAAVTADLRFLMDLENRYNAEGWIGCDSEQIHLARMSNNDCRYFIFEQAGEPLAYAILQGLESPNRNVELKRVAVTQPGRGGGRKVLRIILELAFTQYRAHRLWLDVIVENERARRLYRSIGFLEEGVQRECVLRQGQFRSLVLMSMLEHEYRQRNSEAHGTA
jgi:diamine N-acetyltransferase